MWLAEDVVGATASSTACAAAAAVSDSDSQTDDDDEDDDDQLPAGVTTHPADIADDDDIDENLFDGDDLDIVEQELDSLEVVDWLLAFIVVVEATFCASNKLSEFITITTFVYWFVDALASAVPFVVTISILSPLNVATMSEFL